MHNTRVLLLLLLLPSGCGLFDFWPKTEDAYAGGFGGDGWNGPERLPTCSGSVAAYINPDNQVIHVYEDGWMTIDEIKWSNADNLHGFGFAVGVAGDPTAFWWRPETGYEELEGWEDDAWHELDAQSMVDFCQDREGLSEVSLWAYVVQQQSGATACQKCRMR